LAENTKLRFAVGAFDNWPQVRQALRDARMRGLVLDGFNCLALERMFAGTTIVAPNQERVPIQPLPFPGDAEPIACTSGALSDCLTDRLRSGAGNLNEALSNWLIPRHAARFESMVQEGKILFWMQVADSDDERRAYQCLLTHSSNCVGVHDLVAPGRQEQGDSDGG
jgi:hypothetical protein